MREMLTKTLRFLTPLLVTSAVAGGVLAILAPLGTSNFSLLGRFSYWIGMCLAGGLGAGAVEYGIKLIGKTLQRWPLALAQSFGATTAVSLFAFQIHNTPNTTSVVMTLFYIWVVSITICAVGALQRHKPVDTDFQSSAEADALPPLLPRLKPALRNAQIYALEAQDHYVRVITSAGEDLILMRLSDAINEAAPLPGLSPHRSWWVAQAGMKTVTRRNGKTAITLENDMTIPVSRSRFKTLRAAGWV